MKKMVMKRKWEKKITIPSGGGESVFSGDGDLGELGGEVELVGER